MRVDPKAVAVAVAVVCVATAPAQDLTVRVGHVAQTSGWLAGFGKNTENGARMAIDDLNAKGLSIGGRKARFELVAEDDKGDLNEAATVAQRLVDARVNGVVGHMFSGTSIAASKVYCPAGLPQISPSATNPRFTRSGCRSVFRVLADDLQVAAALSRHAVKDMGVARIALIDDRSDYGQGLVEAFAAAATAAGARVVEAQHIDAKATDFTPQLTAVRARNPDLVFFGGMATQAGPMISQMKQLGLRARFMGGDGVCQPDLPARGGDALGDGQVVCAIPGRGEHGTPAMERFQADFRQRFGNEPLPYAPYAYDAVRVMADAMVRAGSSDPARYLPALAATSGYAGVTGPIAFDDKGDLRNGAVTLFTYKGWKQESIAVVR